MDKTGGKKKNRGGRPLKFKSVNELQQKIDEYFLSCWTQKVDMFGNPIFKKDAKGKKTKEPILVQFRPYTITGLAIALDTYRDVLIDYGNKKRFSNAIKKAKERCHGYAEEQLYVGRNPAGVIFNLKNNYGWKDKSEIDNKVIFPKPLLSNLKDVHNNNSPKKAEGTQ